MDNYMYKFLVLESEANKKYNILQCELGLLYIPTRAIMAVIKYILYIL